MDKIIKQFIINLNDLPFRLTKRKFTIIGDVNSEFILEIKNECTYKNKNNFSYKFKKNSR